LTAIWTFGQKQLVFIEVSLRIFDDNIDIFLVVVWDWVLFELSFEVAGFVLCAGVSGWEDDGVWYVSVLFALFSLIYY
jgi:hypothetical protein